MALKILDHPVCHYFLNRARSKTTSSADFRFCFERITDFLLIESLKDIPTKTSKVETPLETVPDATMIEEEQIVFASIMRAGNIMLEAALRFLPHASAAHIGVFRDQKHEAVQYYFRGPELSDKQIFLLDPMLATGNSSCNAIASLKDHGAKDIRFLSIVSCPEGIEKVQSTYPEVSMFTACVDRKLNEKAYILPGLGDAGDRIYST